MEKDMTKLVHIKTRALEERKELHEKYLELYQELQAQDDYAQKLEENEEVLKAKLTAQAAEDISAARHEVEEMVRLEMQEKIIAAEMEQEQLLEKTAALRAKVADLEAEAAAARTGASETADAAKCKVEALEAQSRQHREEMASLQSRVAQLEQAAEQHDAIFEGTMLEMQAKEEKCVELEERVGKLARELEEATKKVLASETHSESERAATHEALDELTRELSRAHEQLATAEAQADEAERRAQASQQAAACGVARLTHVTVGMAADEDNNTDMIDPELRLHWCDDDYETKLAETKTPHELRALLVGIASTVEHLLNSGAARREQMAEQVVALTAQVEQLEGAGTEVEAARADAAALRKELAEATSGLLEAVERGEALKAQVAEHDAAAGALRQRVEALEDESQRANALLEDTSRENVELSMYKEEVMKLRPEKEALQSSLDACMSKLSQATATEETLRRKAEKKLETLKHNLQVSQNDCQSLDAILAHVRASLQMYVETPSAMPADTLRKLLHRISPDDKLDDDVDE
jgi:chromosome segregation ATPase